MWLGFKINFLPVPVENTIANPLPDMTSVPEKRTFWRSNIVVLAAPTSYPGALDLSCASPSPVKLTNLAKLKTDMDIRTLRD